MFDFLFQISCFFIFFNLYSIELNPDSLWCKLEKFDLYAVFTYFLCFWPINNLWKIVLFHNHSTFSQTFFLLLSTSFGFESRHIVYLFCPGSCGSVLIRLKLPYCLFVLSMFLRPRVSQIKSAIFLFWLSRFQWPRVAQIKAAILFILIV